jgi:hypothetical protein
MKYLEKHPSFRAKVGLGAGKNVPVTTSLEGVQNADHVRVFALLTPPHESKLPTDQTFT